MNKYDVTTTYRSCLHHNKKVLTSNCKYVLDKKHIASIFSAYTISTCPPIFMQLTGQNNGGTASSAFLSHKKQLTGQNLHNEHAFNATWVGTQTSKVSTQVALLFISIR